MAKKGNKGGGSGGSATIVSNGSETPTVPSDDGLDGTLAPPASSPATLHGVDALLADTGGFVGKEVVLAALRSEAMNGARGVVAGVDAATQRLAVALLGGQPDAKPKLLKAENLALVSFAHKEAMIRVFDTMVGTFEMDEPKYAGMRGCAGVAGALRSPSVHDLDVCDGIMETALRRKTLGTHRAHLAAYAAMVKVLPVLVELCGAHSLRVAAALMVIINAFEDLKPQEQDKRAAAVLGYADHLTQACALGPTLSHGGAIGCIVPYLKGSESDRPIDRFYLEAEALNHKASAHQTLGAFDAAEPLYLRAIELAENNGHRELASGMYNNLGTLYQHMAAPALHGVCHGATAATKPGERRLKGSQPASGGGGGGSSLLTPTLFSERETLYMNKALRCALKRLRVTEDLHGGIHPMVAHAHSVLADFCYIARVRKPCVFHAELARLCYAAIGGPDHPDTVKWTSMHRMMATSFATHAACTLEPDVSEGLAKRALCAKCSRSECPQRETEAVKFKKCSQCLVAKYCSPDCAKAAWPGHKAECKRAAAVAAEQSSEAYKAEQRRIKEVEKRNQERFGVGGDSDKK